MTSSLFLIAYDKFFVAMNNINC